MEDFLDYISRLDDLMNYVYPLKLETVDRRIFVAVALSKEL